MKVLKKVIISVCVLAVAYVAVVAVVFFVDFSPDNQVAKETVEDENQSYKIVSVIKENPKWEMDYVCVYIKDKNSGETVYSQDYVCRAYDYQDTSFKQDSNDFVVDSHDVGYITFKYDAQNNTWFRFGSEAE